MFSYPSASILFTNVFATKEASWITLLIAINILERMASAVKNFASCGKTPPLINTVSTAYGNALVSILILSTMSFIETKGKSGSEIKR